MAATILVFLEFVYLRVEKVDWPSFFKRNSELAGKKLHPVVSLRVSCPIIKNSHQKRLLFGANF
jgi:hypothetical protein